jgi:hypothetical protein
MLGEESQVTGINVNSDEEAILLWRPFAFVRIMNVSEKIFI